jgi:hypothetical protein
MNDPVHHHIGPLVDDALAAFWASVAARYPEAKTGDLSPPTAAALDRAAKAAVAEWVASNCL